MIWGDTKSLIGLLRFGTYSVGSILHCYEESIQTHL
jgi:hypothetical protein